MRLRKIIVSEWAVRSIIVLVFGIAFYSFAQDLIIKYWGREVRVTVIRLPERCTRRNSITVSLGSAAYDLGISTKACNTNRYAVGEKLTVLKHDYFNRVIWPDATPGFALLGAIAFLIIALLVHKKQSGAYKAKTERAKTPGDRARKRRP